MVHVLDNGLRVVVQQRRAAPVVAVQMWVGVGSADDTDATSGLAHVLEHMVFKSTSHRSEGEIARQIESAGGQINAWTSFDQTVYHIVIASRFFDRGLDILADALLNSRLQQSELSRELQVILEELKQGEDSNSRLVSRTLFATAYRKHPYRRPVIGRKGAVRAYTAEDVRRFYRRWYTPDNMTLVIVGDVDPAAALKRAGRRFGGTRRGAVAAEDRVAEPRQRKTRLTLRQRPASEAYLTLAFHIPGMMHEDTPALDLAAVILGQGESSRLNRRVKHQQQLASSSYSYAYTPRDPGLLVVGATAPPDRLRALTRAVTHEALRMGTEQVSTEELRRAKTLVASDAVFQKETVQGQARKLGFFQVVAGDLGFEQVYDRRIEEVTPESLRRVAARYLRPENLSLAVVTPGKETEQQLLGEVEAAHATSQALLANKGQQSRGRDGVVKVTLSNGARLLVQQDTSVPLVALRAVWAGGLRLESPAVNGINSLLAALITRGTHSRSADAINGVIEGAAGSISGFAGQNSFGLQAEMLSRGWEQGLEVVADCLLDPAFDPKELDRERRSLLDDIVAQEDNLGAVASQLFNSTLYTKHPYRMDLLGSIRSVGALSRAQLVRFYRRHYATSRMVLSVVGDVEPKQVVAHFRRLFAGRRRAAAAPTRVPREPAITAPRSAHKLVEKQQAHVIVGYPGATMRSRDRFALEVLTSVLSGQGGRLFRELRDRQGLAYHVGAYSYEGLEPGYVAFYIATSPEKVQQALDGIQAQVKRLRDRRVSADELRRVQRYLVGSFEISLQRRSMLAAQLAFNEAYGLGHRAYRKYAPSILAVTAADLQRVARRYLVDRRRVVAMVQPEQRSAGAAKRGPARAGQVLESADKGKSGRKKRSKKRSQKRAGSRRRK